VFKTLYMESNLPWTTSLPMVYGHPLL